MSALWNNATCRVEESGVKPPQSKVCRILNANQYDPIDGSHASPLPGEAKL